DGETSPQAHTSSAPREAVAAAPSSWRMIGVLPSRPSRSRIDEPGDHPRQQLARRLRIRLPPTRPLGTERGRRGGDKPANTWNRTTSADDGAAELVGPRRARLGRSLRALWREIRKKWRIK